MITYTRLGQYGRLGNQLYQIASTVGYALDNKQQYCFNWAYSNIFNVPSCSCSNIEINTTLHEADGLNYNPLQQYSPEMGNVDIFGYLQGYEYFRKHKNEILKLFKVRETTSEYGFIHIRRGDYLNFPMHHPTMSVEYYINGMNVLGKEKYYCFSDDIVWCKNNIHDSRVVFVENTSEVEDLLLMMTCSAAVIANSSFSWWGAYLGNHNNVVAPRNWFGPAYAGFKIEDRIPEGWLIC